MGNFKAFRVHNENDEIKARFDQLGVDQISTGNVNNSVWLLQRKLQRCTGGNWLTKNEGPG